MIDHTAIQLALRARAATLVVCTTGATNLSATAAGYARPAGSFITDGFRAGMEVTPTGFPQADPGVITKAEALLLTIAGGRTVAAEAGARSLSVGLPAQRFLDNEQGAPVAGRPYAEEDYVPGGLQLLGMASGGTKEQTGLYVWRWYGLKGLGIAGLTRCVDQLLELFKPGTSLTLASGDRVRIRGDIAPSRGQVLVAAEGWVVVRVLIPWRLYTFN